MTERTTRIFQALYDRSGSVVAAVVAVSALLVIPLVAMAPTESASTEPTGPVFTARNRIDETFVSSVHPTFFLIEDDGGGGDLLRAEPLRRLAATSEALRNDPTIGPNLFSYFDVETERDVTGMLTIADIVDAELGGGLDTATDDDVKRVGGAIIERLGEDSQALGLSAQSTIDADGRWVVPAVSAVVLSDNEILGFGNTSVNLGGSTDVEEYDRSVQDVLRDVDGLSVFGIAIDVNLTSQEQGAVAGPFIGLTVLAVLLIVGLTFRSYWVLVTVASSLLLLIVWLKGITNLIGLENDLVLSLIVPIAMISFGVDFAFHAIGRYREERAEGRGAERAFVVGLGSVSTALILALTSDTVAFLSNVSAGIESIVQFGLGAGIALAAAYLLLGIVSPLVVARVEAEVPTPTPGLRSTVLRAAAAVGASALTMASVLLLVFIAPAAGAALGAVTIAVILVLPVVVRRRASTDLAASAGRSVPASTGHLSVVIGRVVGGLAARPLLVLPAAAVITAVAASFAVRVPAAFDVEDFFSQDTDFVQGLDLVDQHIGDRGGEPAMLYVEGDLTDPDQLGLLRNRIEELRALDTRLLGRDGDGVRVDGGVFHVFDAVWESPTALAAIGGTAGVELTDDDGDGIPDTSEQVVAVIETAAAIGVPFDENRLSLTPDDVSTSVVLADDGPSATVFEVAVPNSRSQDAVTAAGDLLNPVAESISEDLGGSFVQVTGSPFVREQSLEATNRALLVSLPIALTLCFAVSTIFLRSLRYGVASIVPIIMVVAWLYGFMELAGYAINIVTATIAAVSIGIGIDFALHYIARYREELDRHGNRGDAVRIASEGTGTALVASAFSSAVGFGIMALAPMPLFAAYGLLTALMIIMALAATLVVLPALLTVITSDRIPDELDVGPAPGAGVTDPGVGVTQPEPAGLS